MQKVIVVLIAFVLLTVSCTDPYRNEDVATIEEKQKIADEIIYKITYIKDPRTGLCFAYIWINQGGPSITCVPEETIPKEMLKTAVLR